MDPVIGGALISGASSLFGGLFGKDKGENTWTVMKNQIAGWRELGEQYGFNPLALIGQTGQGYAGNSSNYMGQAIADAGMMFGEAWSKRTDAQKLQRAQERIKELQTKIDHDTIRPKVGGVYAQRESAPMLRSASGGGEHGRPNQDHPLSEQLGDIAVPDPTLDSGSGLYVGGLRVRPTPGWSSGEAFETEYGEGPLAWLYGVGKMASDAGTTVGAYAKDKFTGHFGVTPYEYFNGHSYDNRPRPPDGKTADGKPFWRVGKGIQFKPPFKGAIP